MIKIMFIYMFFSYNYPCILSISKFQYLLYLCFSYSFGVPKEVGSF